MAETPLKALKPDIVGTCSHHNCHEEITWFVTVKIFGVDYLLPVCQKHKEEIGASWPP